jgi:1,4-dihydroxy-2-naphthoate octaprenyltransferase
VVGSALAYREDLFQWLPALICLVFALLVQIGTNFVNDYKDFEKGADTAERIGPPRAVASGWIPAGRMKAASRVVLGSAFLIGCSLIYWGGWWLLGIGVASIACAYLYTSGPVPLAYVGLGDLFVVLFFGLIAVGCTTYVQTGHISREAWALGLGVGLLVNNILVVNNYRDADQDARSNKRTLTVRYGRTFSLIQYQVSLVAASLAPLYVFLQGGSSWVLLACVLYPFGRFTTMRISRLKIDSSFNRALGWTSGLLVLYGVLLTVGLVLE